MNLQGAVKWRGVGVYLLGTGVRQGQLYVWRLREDARPHMTLLSLY